MIDITGGSAKKKFKPNTSKGTAAKKISKAIPKKAKSFKPKPKTFKAKPTKSTKSLVSKTTAAVSKSFNKVKGGVKGTTKSSFQYMTDEVAKQRGHLIHRLIISSILLAAIIYIYYYIFYRYLIHLSDINCTCATQDWKYIWLRAYFIYIMALTSAEFVNNFLQITFNYKAPFFYDFLVDCNYHYYARFNFVLSVVTIIIANLYLQELTAENCDCAEHQNKDVMNLFYVISLLFYGFIGFIIIIQFIVSIFSYSAGGLSRLVF